MRRVMLCAFLGAGLAAGAARADVAPLYGPGACPPCRPAVSPPGCQPCPPCPYYPPGTVPGTLPGTTPGTTPGGMPPDATQQVFIQMLEALARFELRSAPVRGWLFRIVRNHAISHASRERRAEAARSFGRDTPAVSKRIVSLATAAPSPSGGRHASILAAWSWNGKGGRFRVARR